MMPSSPIVVDLREERLALALDVVERADGAELRQRLHEKLFRAIERQRPQIEVLEREQVEREERRRQLDRGALDVERRRADVPRCCSRAKLGLPCASSTTTSPSTMHLVERKRLDRARDFGKDGGVVVAVAREQQRLRRATCWRSGDSRRA